MVWNYKKFIIIFAFISLKSEPMNMSKWSSIIIIFMALFLNSCAIYWTPYANLNSNTTNVELGEGNFTIIGKVEGQASANYVLGIGGFSHRALMGNAMSELYDNAELQGQSKAVVYLTPETRHSGFFPFFYRKSIIIKGLIVEFKEATKN
ncbi:MAG: DUF6567 family protein [Bacteroidales bacterium]